jgi:hypothetical protein
MVGSVGGTWAAGDLLEQRDGVLGELEYARHASSANQVEWMLPEQRRRGPDPVRPELVGDVAEAEALAALGVEDQLGHVGARHGAPPTPLEPGVTASDLTTRSPR